MFDGPVVGIEFGQRVLGCTLGLLRVDFEGDPLPIKRDKRCPNWPLAADLVF